MAGYRVRRFGCGAVVAVAAVAVLAAGCSSGSSGSAPGPAQGGGSSALAPLSLTVGVQSLTDYSSVAMLPFQQGYFKQLNLNVKYILAQSSSAGIAALENGTVDILTGGPEGLTLNAKGADFRAIASASNRSTVHFVTQKSITSLKQLTSASAPVGWTGPSSPTSQALLAGLTSSGVDTSNLKFVALASTSVEYTSLLSGKISGAALAAPYYLEAAAKGLHDWGPTDGTPPEGLGAPVALSSAFMTTQSILNSNGPAIGRFLEGFAQTLSDLYSSSSLRATLTKWMSNDLNIPLGYIQQDYNTYFADPTTNTTYFNKNGTVTLPAMVSSCLRYVQFGSLPKGTDCKTLSEQFTDNNPLLEAEAALAKHPLQPPLATPLPAPLSAA